MNKSARRNYIRAMSQVKSHKVLHKVRKHWEVIGLSVLMMMAGGYGLTHAVAHASTLPNSSSSTATTLLKMNQEQKNNTSSTNHTTGDNTKPNYNSSNLGKTPQLADSSEPISSDPNITITTTKPTIAPLQPVSVQDDFNINQSQTQFSSTNSIIMPPSSNSAYKRYYQLPSVDYDVENDDNNNPVYIPNTVRNVVYHYTDPTGYTQNIPLNNSEYNVSQISSNNISWPQNPGSAQYPYGSGSQTALDLSINADVLEKLPGHNQFLPGSKFTVTYDADYNPRYHFALPGNTYNIYTAINVHYFYNYTDPIVIHRVIEDSNANYHQVAPDLYISGKNANSLNGHTTFNLDIPSPDGMSPVDEYTSNVGTTGLAQFNASGNTNVNSDYNEHIRTVNPGESSDTNTESGITIVYSRPDYTFDDTKNEPYTQQYANIRQGNASFHEIVPHAPVGFSLNNKLSIRHIIRTLHFVSARTGQKIAPDVTQDDVYKQWPVFNMVNGKFLGYFDCSSSSQKNAEEEALVLFSTDLNNVGYLAETSGPSTNTLPANDPKSWINCSANNGANDGWPEYDSPDLSSEGYGAPDISSVNAATPPVTSPNVVETIKYPDSNTPESQSVNHILTIHYQNKSGQTISPDKTETVTYTRNGTKDNVTGNIDWDNWQQSGSWSPVTSPNISGYDAPSESVVNDPTPDVNGQDKTETVIYSDATEPTSQTVNHTLTIHYQNKSGQTLSPDKTETVTYTRNGTKNNITGNINWNSWQQSGNWSPVTSPNINEYGMPSESVVNDPAPGADGQDKTETVIYPDATKQESQSASHTLTVHYQNDSGQSIYPDQTETVTYNRTGSRDEVTGNISWNNWQQSGNWNPIASPTIDNYGTPDKSIINDPAPGADGQDKTEVVTYPDATEQVPNVKDYYLNVSYHNEAGQTISPGKTETVTYTRTGTRDKVTGNINWGSWQQSGGWPAITSPTINNYGAPDKSVVNVPVPDANTGHGMSVIVTYPDATEPESQSTSHTLTVHYQNESGQPIHPDQTETVTYSRTGSRDKVTGNINWGNWQQSGNWPTITSPTISNYGAPDKASINDQTPDVNGQNKSETVTYPDATEPESQSTSHTLTVHYQNESGQSIHPDQTETVTYNRTGSRDKVTGNISWNNWQQSGSWPTVTSPSIANYAAPDKAEISDQTPDVNGQDKAEIVTYPDATEPESQSTSHTLTVHYKNKSGQTIHPDKTEVVSYYRSGSRDKVTGHTSWNDWQQSGLWGEVVSPDIANYTAPNKAVINDATPAVNGQDKVENVIYSDATTPESQTTSHTLTVHYHNKAGQTISPDKTEVVTYNRTGSKDSVTGNINWNNWQQSGNWDKIISPSIMNYATPDKPMITDSTPGANGQDKTETVTYPDATEPESQSVSHNLVIHYYDDNNHTISPDKIETVTYHRTGLRDKVNGNINWGNWSQSGSWSPVTSPSIANYAAPDKAEINDQTPSVNGQDKTEIVTYPDATAPESQTINHILTVHYVDKNGRSISPDKNEVVTYTRNGSMDKATGQTTWNGWHQSGNWSPIISPNITNYASPNKLVITDATPNVDGQNKVETVTYPDATEPESQTIGHVLTVHYHNNSGQVISPDKSEMVTYHRTGSRDKLTGNIAWNNWNQSGNWNPIISPNITNYTKPDKAEINDPTPGADGQDKTETVTYPDATEPASQTINHTLIIHYRNKSGQDIAPDKTETVTYHRTGSKDKVTNNITWNTWQQSGSWSPVHSPSITNYAVPDKPVISDQTPSVNGAGKTETVTYPDATKPESQTVNHTLTIHYRNKSGQDIAPDKTETVTYHRTGSEDEVTGKITWNNWNQSGNWSPVTSPSITNYTTPDKPVISEHTPGVNGQGMTDTVTYPDATEPESQTVSHTLIIHYRNKGGQDIAPSKTETVTYHRTGTRDKVTGKITWNNWNQSGDWSPVHSPSITNYTTPDKPVISEHTPGVNGQGMTDTVTYPDATEPESQTVNHTLIIHYRNKDGKTIHPDTTENVVYHRTGSRDKVTGKITWNNWQKSGNWNKVTVPSVPNYMKPSKAVIDDQTPGVDGNNKTETVTYQDATAPASQTVIRTMTVHYQNESGQTISPDKVETVTYHRNGVLNKVSNKVSWENWQQSKGWHNIVSPVIAGYGEPSQQVVTTPAPKVNGSNIDVVVKYAPIINPIMIKPIVPVVPTRPKQQPKPAQPAKPTKPNKPVKTNKPAKVTKPNKPKPVKKLKHTKVIKPRKKVVKSPRHIKPRKSGKAIHIVKASPTKPVKGLKLRLLNNKHYAHINKRVHMHKHINKQVNKKRHLPQTGETDNYNKELSAAFLLAFVGLLCAYFDRKRKEN